MAEELCGLRLLDVVHLMLLMPRHADPAAAAAPALASLIVYGEA
jgi:hypothetical protein